MNCIFRAGCNNAENCAEAGHCTSLRPTGDETFLATASFPCACRFTRREDFGASEAIEWCGFHAKLRDSLAEETQKREAQKVRNKECENRYDELREEHVQLRSYAEQCTSAANNAEVALNVIEALLDVDATYDGARVTFTFQSTSDAMSYVQRARSIIRERVELVRAALAKNPAAPVNGLGQPIPPGFEVDRFGEVVPCRENAPLGVSSVIPEGWKLVPVEPVEDQWGELARDIVMWRDLRFTDGHTAETLRYHLEALGREIPAWLHDELRDKGHLPKGSVTTLIYKAMLDAAPKWTDSQGGHL